MAWELLGSIGGVEERPFEMSNIARNQEVVLHRYEAKTSALIVVIAESDQKSSINSWRPRAFVGDFEGPVFERYEGETSFAIKVDTPGVYEVGIRTGTGDVENVWGTVYLARL